LLIRRVIRGYDLTVGDDQAFDLAQLPTHHIHVKLMIDGTPSYPSARKRRGSNAGHKDDAGRSAVFAAATRPHCILPFRATVCSNGQTRLGRSRMIDQAQARSAMIAFLEGALDVADRLADGETAYLIERALDRARSTSVKDILPERLLH
jgi:hypothetical protein